MEIVREFVLVVGKILRRRDRRKSAAEIAEIVGGCRENAKCGYVQNAGIARCVSDYHNLHPVLASCVLPFALAADGGSDGGVDGVADEVIDERI